MHRLVISTPPVVPPVRVGDVVHSEAQAYQTTTTGARPETRTHEALTVFTFDPNEYWKGGPTRADAD